MRAMAKNYRLDRVPLGLSWDSFVDKSEGSTIFSSSTYLVHTGCNIGLFHCYNADELRAAIVVIESPDGIHAILDDFVIYGGLFFGPPMTGQSESQKISEHFELSTYIADKLAGQYQTISFSLAPAINDIRPFLWYKYAQENVGRYRADIRYTSYLNIEDFKDAKKLEDISSFLNASVARRQQIRYSRREGVIVEITQKVSTLIDFYLMTMKRQGEVILPKRLERMEKLISGLLEAQMAEMYVAKTKDGVAGSMAVFVFDSKRAYYLFGANDPAFRDTPLGTAVLWEAFYYLSKKGLNQVDLEGVNSPRRGWFKLSFGGTLLPYYQIGYSSP